VFVPIFSVIAIVMRVRCVEGVLLSLYPKAQADGLMFDAEVTPLKFSRKWVKAALIWPRAPFLYSQLSPFVDRVSMLNAPNQFQSSVWSLGTGGGLNMKFDDCNCCVKGLTAADCHGGANADGPVNLNSCGLGAVVAGRAFAAATASPGGRRAMSKVRGTMENDMLERL
jgi:hypothetical protein